jgi:hypothetical protein
MICDLHHGPQICPLVLGVFCAERQSGRLGIVTPDPSGEPRPGTCPPPNKRWLRTAVICSEDNDRKDASHLGFHAAVCFVSAFVAFENADFGAVSFDLIRRTPGQMRIAAALGTADRSNECQFLGDKGTPVHSPRPQPYPRL